MTYRCQHCQEVFKDAEDKTWHILHNHLKTHRADVNQTFLEEWS